MLSEQTNVSSMAKSGDLVTVSFEARAEISSVLVVAVRFTMDTVFGTAVGTDISSVLGATDDLVVGLVGGVMEVTEFRAFIRTCVEDIFWSRTYFKAVTVDFRLMAKAGTLVMVGVDGNLLQEPRSDAVRMLWLELVQSELKFIFL